MLPGSPRHRGRPPAAGGCRPTTDDLRLRAE